MQIDTPKWINYTSALKTIEVVWRPWLWERQILDLCFVVDCFSLRTVEEKTLYGIHALGVSFYSWDCRTWLRFVRSSSHF
jgi:hypothetical protein